MKRKLNFKIAIIGAGPAGCSCAIALIKKGIRDVIIIDNSKTGKFHIGESVPPDINSVFKELGIYASFIAENHEPCYGSCSYWGSNLRGYNDSILSPFGHGWHLDRSKFNLFMIEEAIKQGATVLRNSSYRGSNITNTGYNMRITSESGASDFINTQFVVDASGTRGVFASDRESKKNHNTPLVCLSMRFKNKGCSVVSKLTHLESVEHGWWYAAKIPEEKLLVSFYTTAEVIKNKSLHDIKNWFELLKGAKNTYKRIEQMKPIGAKIRGFYTPTFCLSRIVGENWLAIGDAASTYDPITSQGIIKSMSQGIRSSEIIDYYMNGSHEALMNFENEIKYQYGIYNESREYFYNLEQRWQSNPFWKTMQTSNSVENN